MFLVYHWAPLLSLLGTAGSVGTPGTGVGAPRGEESAFVDLRKEAAFGGILSGVLGSDGVHYLRSRVLFLPFFPLSTTIAECPESELSWYIGCQAGLRAGI